MSSGGGTLGVDLDLLGAEEVGVESGALETDLDERVVGVSLIG